MALTGTSTPTSVLTTTKAGTTAGVIVGVVAGFISYNKGAKPTHIALSVAIFGIGSYLIGNAVTKFYE